MFLKINKVIDAINVISCISLEVPGRGVHFSRDNACSKAEQAYRTSTSPQRKKPKEKRWNRNCCLNILEHFRNY